MASEAKRAFWRFTANYTRLTANLGITLVVLPLSLRLFGTIGYGVSVLITSVVMFPVVLQPMVDQAILRPLGAAYHSGDARRFSEVYNAAIVLSAAAAVVLLVLCGGLYWFILPVLDVPPALFEAAQWLLITRAAIYFFHTLLITQMEWFLITERMASYNLWLLWVRLGFLPGLLAVLPFAPVAPAVAIKIFSVASAVFTIVGTVVLGLIPVLRDRRLLPRPKQATRQALRQLATFGGWNVPVLGAVTLHERSDQLLMNLFFGPVGNAQFGVASQASAYVRMFSTGMTTGLDAVSARISTAAPKNLALLVWHSTRLHALSVFASLIGMCVLAHPVLALWLGSSLESPGKNLAFIVPLVQILSVAWAIKAITDNWVSILYGAGHIRRYSLWLLVGGLLHVPLAAIFVCLLPATVSYTGPAWAFVLTLFLVNLVLLAFITGKSLEVPLSVLLLPIVRPALATGLAGVGLVVLARTVSSWTIWNLLGVTAAYAFLLAVTIWWIAMDTGERRRLLNSLGRPCPRPAPNEFSDVSPSSTDRCS